jgi:tetratricopeptide (TPR) repeat protein
MSPISIKQELDGIGRKIKHWRAQLKMGACVAGVLGFVWLFSLLDLWMHYGKAGRACIAVILYGGLAAGVWWIMRTLRHSFTVQGVAAMVERAFPQLDNHLINYLQFADASGDDVFKKAYVSQGVPQWSGLDFDEMRQRDKHKRVNIAMAVAGVLLLVPALFLGSAWGVSMYRVVNPFTDMKPISLTNILTVAPGTASVLQGDPAVLTVTVQGRAGHKVSVDIDAADQESTSHALGKISASDQSEEFSFRIPKVNADTRYRFRAGDAALPEWYTLTTRPPLALDDMQIEVQPPAYTGLPVAKFDGLADDLVVQDGSILRFNVHANLPVKVMAFHRGDQVVPMQANSPGEWSGELTITNGSTYRLLAEADAGDKVEQALLYAFEPDRLPGIQILAPEGRPVLTPGSKPVISFTVEDEFGLGTIEMEQVIVGASRDAKGKVLKTWDGTGSKTFSQTWQDDNFHSRTEQVLAYRIVARDNYPFGDEKRVAASARIIFEAPGTEQLAAQRQGLEKEAFAALSKVIELQKLNISKTKVYEKMLASSTPANWKETADRQREIRTMTKALLSNPLNPLGTLTSVAKNLYVNEMAEVIPVLEGVPNTAEAGRPGRVARALVLEEKILRQFMFADSAAAKAKVQRRVSALTNMLKQLIKSETTIIKDTRQCVSTSASVGEVLIDRQDELALDLTDFIKSCRAEGELVRANDEGYANLLVALADKAEADKIRGDMMLAASQLEVNKPADAAPHEEAALSKLKQLAVLLEEVEALEGQEEQEALLEQIEEAKKRLEKIQEVYKKALEAMDMVGDQKDKSTKDTDMLEEEYEEIMKNIREAMLQVPTDLNIFMELNVANDIVEDVFTVFEEVVQAEGSEDLSPEDVKDRALAKREEYLEGMEEAKDRLDGLESWLMDHPDDMKITTEAFDQEEMPEAGMALGALTTEAEDLIGDLMEKEEDMAEEADDSATNTAVPDMVPNNEVKEGDVASFAAQGKSGNETPDHKEQDGRSNVGRQGMAVGETAAGSGTISEGDKNIEERRTQEPTQSGQVDVEGEDVDTKATGGGKLGTGKADDVGMEGGAKRMDSQEAGSAEGMDSLMSERAEAMYAKASMQNVRSDSLKDAAHHLRQAEDAVARGNIAQLKEHRKAALASLKKAKAQIDATMTGTFNLEAKPSFIDDVVEGGPDAAPEKYRDLVAEYYKSLNENL